MATRAVVSADLLILAAEYLQVREAAARAVRRREELKAKLKAAMIDLDADVVLVDELTVGDERLVPTFCEQTVVDAEGLQQSISKALWGRLTTQVLELPKYFAAREAGQIKPEVVDAVEASANYWQLRTFTNLPKRPVK